MSYLAFPLVSDCWLSSFIICWLTMETLKLNQNKLRALTSVFIVDDDEDDRELLTDALIENHLLSSQIQTAVDGMDFIDKLTSATVLPSLIILDLNMPRMGGREVLSSIRENARFRHIPIIMFTTSDADIDVKDCYSLGCNTYMTKPSDYGSLLSAVQIMLMYWTSNSTLITY